MKLVLACALLLTPVAPGQCASASCFGPTGTDPLVISGSWNIAAGANLNFGPRHVILATGATLFLHGPASITAAQLTGQAGSTIDGTTVPYSDLSITTTPAGAHDGSTWLAGTTNLAQPGPVFFNQSAGSFTLNAGGAAIVNLLDTSAGVPGDVGAISIHAPSITIGTIVADTNESFEQAAVITLMSTGPVTVGSITAQTGDNSSSPQVTITGSSYTQAGDILASPWSGGGNGSGGGSVTINASGAVSIQGQIRTGGPYAEYGGGGISITAGGFLSWTSAVGDAGGQRGGIIWLQSLGSDVVFSGSLAARCEGDIDDGGGTISIQAGGHVDFTGALDVSTAQTFPTNYGVVPYAYLTAGRTLRIHAGSLLQARDAGSGCTSVGGVLWLTGCRIVVDAGASVISCSGHPLFGSTVLVAARELVRVDGSISVGSPPAQMYPGQVLVSSRLPWPAAYAGSGTIAPPPVVTVDPTLLPCVAESTLVTATSPVTAGQSITLSVTSQPQRPLVIIADLSIAHLPLGSFGWSQVNFFTGYRVADGIGALGPVIPAATDSNGQWSWSIVTPVTPLLTNTDVYFDIYVIDPASLKGLFQQAPAIIHFN